MQTRKKIWRDILVTVGAHEVVVITFVVYTVEVVY
jgi:hypothetical protein